MARKRTGDGDNVVQIKPTDRDEPSTRTARPRGQGTGQTTTRPENIVVAERRADAIGLRRAGLPFNQIAEIIAAKYQQPGYDRASAHRDVKTAMGAIIEAPAREMVEEELDRYNALMAAHWADATTAVDRDVRVKAAGVVLKISQARRALLGLDSPIRHNITGTGATIIDLDDPATLREQGLGVLAEITEAASTRRGRANQRAKRAPGA